MKLIKLNILSKVVDTTSIDTDQAYKNVLDELGIPNNEIDRPDDDSYFRPVFINKNVLIEEMLSVYERYENNEHSIIEYFDGRTMIIDITADTLAKLLDDTIEI
jgi:hypothetical protein